MNEFHMRWIVDISRVCMTEPFKKNGTIIGICDDRTQFENETMFHKAIFTRGYEILPLFFT